MVECVKQFGFYPHELEIEAGEIKISTLSDLESKINAVNSDKYVEKDWIYSSPRRERDFLSGRVRELPYTARVFGLPKTHTIKHAAAKSEEHIDFLVWALSFFVGMRLTTTKAGFLDATPLKENELVDFYPTSLKNALMLANDFWNKSCNKCCSLFTAAIHALFISQNPRNLSFEEFIYSYMAIDACYALTKRLYLPNKKTTHKERIHWMCNKLELQVPAWGDPKRGLVSAIRNETLHEALFMEQPLGFAVCAEGSFGELPFEMSRLVCRLLVALIKARDKDYISSPVDRRTYRRLRLH